MTLRRWPADGPLALLFILTVALFAAAGWFMLGNGLAVDPLVTCQTIASTIVVRLSSIGVLLPGGLAASAIIAAILALTHQISATRRVLRPILYRRVPLSAAVDRAAGKAGLADRIDLVDDRHAFTFCYGLRSPRVCVSAGLTQMLTEEELTSVLRHEAHHALYHDPLKILLGRALASGLYFLPLAGALRNGFLAGKEICADRAAAVGPRGERALARALVKLIDADRPQWPSGVLAIGAFSPTEARLRQLVTPDELPRILPAPADWILSAMVLAGIFGFAHGAAATVRSAPMSLACEAIAPKPEASIEALVLAPCTAPASAPFSAANSPGEVGDC